MQVNAFIATAHKRPQVEQKTYALFRSHGFEPRFIDRPEPSRVAECIKRTKTDIFILCDEDVHVEKTVLIEAINLLINNPYISKLSLSEGSVMGIAGDFVETRYVTGCAIIKKAEGKTALATNLTYTRL